MTRIRIGVLGCASIASTSVIPAIKLLEDEFELIAVASREISKAKLVSATFGCIAIEGYQKMIELENIEALYIPLPTGLHYEWIKKAIISGKHVYAEKSFASDFIYTKELVALAKEKRVALMEGYMFQYHSQHQFVKNLLNKAEIGEIRHFSASFCFPPLKEDNFRYDPIVGGGAVLDAAGYTVRSAFFILGDALKLVSATVKYQNQCSLYGSAFMTGENGLGISLIFGFDNFYQCEYSILGSIGKISLQRAYTPRKDEKTVCIVEKQGVKSTFTLPACNHFEEAFKEFHHIIVNDKYREKHYADILLQSKMLTNIFEITSNSINE